MHLTKQKKRTKPGRKYRGRHEKEKKRVIEGKKKCTEKIQEKTRSHKWRCDDGPEPRIPSIRVSMLAHSLARHILRSCHRKEASIQEQAIATGKTKFEVIGSRPP